MKYTWILIAFAMLMGTSAFAQMGGQAEGSGSKPMEHPGMGSGTKPVATPVALAPEVKPDGLAAKADGIAAKKDELAAKRDELATKVEDMGNKVENAGSKLRSKPMDHPSAGSGMKHQGSGTK